jgi:hypothetical protein
MEMVDQFLELNIDEQTQNYPKWKQGENHINQELCDRIVGQKVLLLKNNQNPKGLIPLERLFDQNDIIVKSSLMQPHLQEVKDCSIGSKENLKFIKLSKYLPHEYKQKYIDFLKEYVEVFAWSYEDLKNYDTNIIQHKIPLNFVIKPFKQNIRKINHILLPMIEKEVKKLLDANIIIPYRYSTWVVNLVPIRKKNGEIRLCVDF